jgi:predicted porin
MKKSLIALAALSAIAGSAASADELKFYGLVSAGVVSGSGIGNADKSQTVMSDQGHSSNRWGFMGSEDLGNGMKAKFQLESNMSLRSGGAGKDSGGTTKNGDPLFDREANVSLESSDWGQIKLGRGKNFLYNVLDEYDARGNWNFGALKSVARYAGFYGGSGVSRYDNMVRYTSPSFSGLSFDYAYGFGGDLTDSTKSNKWNVGARYEMENFGVAYTHSDNKISSTDINNRIDLLAARYTMGDLYFDAGYAMTRNPAGSGSFTTQSSSTSKVDNKPDADTYFIGARYKLNDKLGLNAGYYNVKDKTASATGVNDLQMAAVGMTYSFSKRTEFYVDYASAIRKSGATAAFTTFDRYSDGSATFESKYDQNAINVGIQHRF